MSQMSLFKEASTKKNQTAQRPKHRTIPRALREQNELNRRLETSMRFHELCRLADGIFATVVGLA